jgi:hypothetical protein
MSYFCLLCNYTTNRESNFTRHTQSKRHIQNVKKKYRCLCGKEHLNRMGLWRHKKVCNLRKKHKDAEEEKEEEDYQETKEDNHEGNEPNILSANQKEEDEIQNQHNKLKLFLTPQKEEVDKIAFRSSSYPYSLLMLKK